MSNTTGTELIVRLCYGNAKSKKSREAGRVVVNKLREHQTLTKSVLIEEVNKVKGIDLNAKSSDDRDRFDYLINPLRNSDEGGLYKCLYGYSESGSYYYELSESIFDEVSNRIRQNAKYNLSQKPSYDIQRLRDRVFMLQDEVSDVSVGKDQADGLRSRVNQLVEEFEDLDEEIRKVEEDLNV